MNLLTTYEHMLNLGGLVVSPDGLVSVALEEKTMPALISVKEDTGYVEKRLVLPTNEQLRLEGGWDKRIAFHPLKENIFSGESKVIEYLRRSINFRINQVIAELIDQSLVYASSTDHHKKLSKEQLDLLEALKEADATMISNYRKLLKQVKTTDTKNSFVSIYLKKLGKIGNESYACVGSVNFPFYNDLIEAEKEFHGVKLRKNDFACLRRILEFIIPNIQIKEHYNVGVSESIAPFAECLIRLTNKLGNELNKVTTLLYKKSTHIPKDEREQIYNLLYFSDDHMATFDDLDSLLPEIRVIPQLPGNDSKETEARSTPPIKEQEMIPQRNQWDNLTPQPHPMPESYVQPKTVPQAQPQPVPNTTLPSYTPSQQGRVVDELPPFRELKSVNPYGYQPQIPQPMYAPQMQGYPQPMANPYMAQPQPQVPFQQMNQPYQSPFTPKHMMYGPQLPQGMGGPIPPWQPNPHFQPMNQPYPNGQMPFPGYYR